MIQVPPHEEKKIFIFYEKGVISQQIPSTSVSNDPLPGISAN